MPTIDDIRALTEEYARERAQLAERVADLQAEMERLKRRAIRHIRRGVARTAEAHDALASAIKASPDLFVEPRSIVVAGIRVGLQKGKETVEFEDEAALIVRIEGAYDDPQGWLINVKKSVSLSGLAKLTDDDLARLRCRRVPGTDGVLIKPTDSQVDKLVAALLKDAEHIETEETAP